MGVLVLNEQEVEHDVIDKLWKLLFTSQHIPKWRQLPDGCFCGDIIAPLLLIFVLKTC